MNIIFITVRDTQAKLAKLCSIAQRHFSSATPLLFMTADEKAKSFLDELLWKMPPESFLPHVASNMPCKELIAITSGSQNVNEAKAIFNLTPAPLTLEQEGLTIYEFDEQSSEARRKASEERYNAYRQKGLPISTES